MYSLKDLAAENHVTYEAIRQQIKRYAVELDGHIFMEGKTQYLDDTAVEFLRNKRKRNPVIVYEQNRDEEVERLRQENYALLLKLQEKSDRLEAIQAQLLEAKKEPLMLAQATADLKIAEGKIENQNNELARLKSVIEQETAQSREAKERAQQAEENARTAMEREAAAQKELEEEKQRKLTFTERLTGRKRS